MTFRDRLAATIAAARSVLEAPEVLVVGSEVPNLLEQDAASTLVVSQDLDIGVPVARHADVKRRLPQLRSAFTPSSEEPSVWTPRSDPGPQRGAVAAVLRRLEALEGGAR